MPGGAEEEVEEDGEEGRVEAVDGRQLRQEAVRHAWRTRGDMTL